jgi:osmotically-inducible protein OsmY
MRTKNKNEIALAALLLSVGAALAGCAGGPSYQGDTRDAARAQHDELITRAIEQRLNEDPRFAARRLDISTYWGTVQLRGVVENAASMLGAMRIALATPGVRTVRNDIRRADRHGGD